MSSFCEIHPTECVVLEAREYARAHSETKLHPVVKFSDGKNTYQITNRYILYHFLKRLDDDLSYLDMMGTFYDTEPEYTLPSMGNIIQGYLHSVEEDSIIGVWVEESEIVLVEENSTLSKYFNTTMAYIGANFLPEYTSSIRFMKAGKNTTNSYPVMVFSKDNIKIEILSHNQKTFIAGRYKWLTQSGGVWSQPRPVGFCPRWAHLIPHHFLSMMLDDFRILESMDELTKHSTVVRGGGESSRLERWNERNSLEGENMFRFDRKTIQTINSFCYEEE